MELKRPAIIEELMKFKQVILYSGSMTVHGVQETQMSGACNNSALAMPGLVSSKHIFAGKKGSLNVPNLNNTTGPVWRGKGGRIVVHPRYRLNVLIRYVWGLFGLIYPLKHALALFFLLTCAQTQLEAFFEYTVIFVTCIFLLLTFYTRQPPRAFSGARAIVGS